MNFVGNGACRTHGGDWKGKSLGYMTKEECISKCKSDPDCRAVDVARPDEVAKCDCHHFFGDDKSLHAAYDPTFVQCFSKRKFLKHLITEITTKFN